MALETMDLHEVRSAMEGILFAAGEPVNIDRICLALELDKLPGDAIVESLRQIRGIYDVTLLKKR